MVSRSNTKGVAEMGQAVLIIGESGTGKSASMRNFKRDEVTLLNVAKKALPFKGRFVNEVQGDSYREIKKALKEMTTPVAVIDDSQYLMANEFMRRSEERGYDKFTEIAKNYWELITLVGSLDHDKVVYFMSHLETDAEGRQKIKTIGKLLDEKITVEGLFTVVLKTKVQDGKFSFLTQNSGKDTVKSPMGMFGAVEIENDLKAVDTAIRVYYEMETPIGDHDRRAEDEPVADIPAQEPAKEPWEDVKVPEVDDPTPVRRTRKTRN